MKKSMLLLLIIVTTFHLNGQNIFDDIINKVIKSKMDTIEPMNLTIKDSLFTKLSLNINAVSRIKLNNGNTVEGFMGFASGGHVNGFFFKNGESNCHLANSVFRLDMRFKKLIRKSKNQYQIIWDESRFFSCDTVYFSNVQEIFFLEKIGNSRIGSPSKMKLNKSPNGYFLNLSRKNDAEIEYRLLDTLTVYPALSPDSYIRKADISNPIRILVSEILEFEFLEKPNEKWIEIIETNRIEAKRHNLAQDEWRANSYSNWYHDIRQDKELMDFIQMCINMQYEALGSP